MNQIKPSAGAIIVKDNKILLQKRAEIMKQFPGRWSIPGGKVDYGETVEEALKREVKEEMGVDIVIKEFMGYFDEIFPDFHHIVFAFIGTVDGEIKLNEESSEYGWFTFEEALQLDLAFKQKKILEDYSTKHKNN